MKHRTGWTRQLFLCMAFALGALASPWLAAQTPQANGQWANGPNLPYFPTHIHLLPNSNVMLWPGDGVSGDDPRVWNPASGSVTTLSRAGFDPFCSAHTFLPDGRLFVAGGHIDNWVGLPEAAIYNPANNTWTRQARMNLGRWYPTVTGLANGDVLVVSGAVDTPNGTNPLPQVWQAASGTWRDLTSAELMLPIYPYMFLAPNGSVFNAGPEVFTRYLNTAGTGTWTGVGNRTFNGVRDYGSAVMYEPGKILTVGGGDPPTNTAEVIDLNTPNPTWRAVGSMSAARRSLNAVMLPDGKVLAVGGTRGPGFNNASAGMPVLTAELWNPATESWSVMAAGSVPRLYHSTALLLPDARVLSAGGNGYTQTEIFSPPYLFAGARPSISSAPATAAKGQSIFVGTPDAASITEVSWVALPSVTHTNNMHQGFFRSTSVTQAGGGINIVAPNDPTVPAGFYMLFLLRNGVPSTSRMIQLGPQSGNPAPSVASIAPANAAAGGTAFSLSVNGANFVNASRVRWNGADRPTTFVSATQLTAAITAADIAAAGTAQVSVSNPAPGVGTSQSLAFAINASPPPPSNNPVPALASLAPAGASAGSGGLSLTVNGSNFVAGSVVRWNGANRTTTFVSATRLTAAIAASDTATAGTAQVSVFNPTPGGGVSAAQPFAVTAVPPAGQNLTALGTPIARVTAPQGGGSRSLQTIRDGVTPPVGSTTGWGSQYDTYDGTNTAPDDWIGYQYTSAQSFGRMVFQEGMHFDDGGWFTSLTVQVRQAGTWVNVSGLSVAPAYPGTNNGINFETYTLQFAPISGDAIRLYGVPGGGSAFISVAELQVFGGGATTPANPVPALASLAPASAAAGGAGFALTVDGSNFVAGSVVRWNGANRTTTFVSATRLTAAIAASDTATAGTAQVSVFNPTPGGGVSAAQPFAVTAVPPAGQNLTALGTPIARVTAPQGGGSRSLQTIRDGVTPPVGSTTGWGSQYDTYDGPNTAPDDWIGYQYTSAQSFGRMVFQEGMHFGDGGWFTSLTVQVRQAGTWVNVSGLSVAPAYPGTNNGINFETYTLQFAPISGDAIRLYGVPGGGSAFISVAELLVFGP
ncbi:IPT/TIG domain-containing protein [Polaromonas glacialis]|uniref:IPT/TIG domain-containing protein n=1 Tax=Polaromonas glacialis TaxID=866564 RepID=UPI0012EC4902|nr:IPT/TIG domain-containing protein [Polaromonas glacialis]